MLQRLTNAITARPGIATLVCLGALLVAGTFGGAAPVKLADTPGDDFADSAAQTWTTLDAIEAERPDSGFSTFVTIDLPADDPTSAESTQRIDAVRALLDDDQVARVNGPLISKDGSTALMSVATRDGVDQSEFALQLRDETASIDGTRVGGAPIIQETINAQVEADLGAAEMFAFPLLFLASIWVFRSLVGAFMPLLTGAGTITLTFLALVVFDSLVPMSVFAVNLVFALGLGLAVDYSLLIVTRMREARRMGYEPRAAVAQAVRATATTIMFSALTVASAMAALTVFEQRFLWSMGVGGVFCAIAAAIVSLTLLPAMLALLGDNIDRGRRRRWARTDAANDAADHGAWASIARLTMRRPGLVVATITVAALIVLTPLARIEFTGVDSSVLPTGNPAREASRIADEQFPQIGATTLSVVTRDATTTQLDEAVAAALADAPSSVRAAAGPPRPAEQLGDLTIAEVPVIVRPNEDAAHDLARLLRDDVDGVDLVGVTGAPTITIDTLASFADAAPTAILIAVLSTFVLVFLFTGSVVLPVKAVVMNLVGVAAAMSALVLVFQDGRFEGLLGYEGVGAIEASQPILIIAIAFGLSTDYGIILMGRIKEERERGASTTDAVAIALQRTGRLLDERGAAAVDRARCVRDEPDRLHPAGRRRLGDRRARRRHDRPRAAGSQPDVTAGRVELVGAELAAPPA